MMIRLQQQRSNTLLLSLSLYQTILSWIVVCISVSKCGCYYGCHQFSGVVDAVTTTTSTTPNAKRLAFVALKQSQQQSQHSSRRKSSTAPPKILAETRTASKYGSFRKLQNTVRRSSTTNMNKNNDVGGYDPSEGIEISDRGKERSNVGNPQQVLLQEKEFSVTSILKELAAIQQQGPQKYCILGTRHCSYLHQQIIELLAYALVLSGNHVYTSGSSGTNAATIRGALRAERPDLLTVVLPQSLMKQTEESQQLLKQVKDVVEMPQNNDLSLDIASRICNSYLLSLTDQLISFAFHESTTVIEAAKEAKELDKLVTVLYLD